MSVIKINRAPVLTLWGVVVAERIGHSHETALTLGKFIAGQSAFAKAKSLGLAEEAKKRVKPAGRIIAFMGRKVPVRHSKTGLLAMEKDKPINPDSVERYLAGKFGEHLGEVRHAMQALAESRSTKDLEAHAFELYTKFRPSIPAGVEGWGKAGLLKLNVFKKLIA